jgi:hypothetical protein
MMSTTVQVTSAGRTGGLQQICKLGFVPSILLIFCGFGRTRLSSDFGEFVLVGRVGFSLRISEIDKVTEHKFCVSYVLMIHL